jgi:hypothetical protein
MLIWMESKLRDWRSACADYRVLSTQCNLHSFWITNLGIRVHLEAGRRRVEGGDLGDVVVLALALLFLELEGDAAEGAALDALHQVGREAQDLVAQPLGGHHSLHDTNPNK